MASALQIMQTPNTPIPLLSHKEMVFTVILVPTVVKTSPQTQDAGTANSPTTLQISKFNEEEEQVKESPAGPFHVTVESCQGQGIIITMYCYCSWRFKRDCIVLHISTGYSA